MLELQSQNFLLSHPLPLPLYAYYDGHGKLANISNVSWIDLVAAQPRVADYVTQNLLSTSSIQQDYASGRLKCVTRTIMNRTGVCKDVLTLFKVAAIYDAAVEKRLASKLIWVDSDCYFRRSPHPIWSWATNFDITTIFRRRRRSDDPEEHPSMPETGIMTFKTNTPIVRELLQAAVRAYRLPQHYRQAGSLNDIAIFNWLFNTFHGSVSDRGLRLGRLAVGCRRGFKDPKKAKPWEKAANAFSYENDPTRVDCPHEGGLSSETLPLVAPSISPFNIFYYITHAKSHGPMGKGGLGHSPHNAPGVVGVADFNWASRIYPPNASATMNFVNYSHTYTGRCCATSTVEAGRNGRCTNFADTGRCARNHRYCPVACGVCTICQGHPSYNLYMGLWRRTATNARKTATARQAATERMAATAQAARQGWKVR